MHIIINNKYLFDGYYKVKCAVGKRGIVKNLRKVMKLHQKVDTRLILFFIEKIASLICLKISKYIIKKNMGWCDDPISKNYNKLVKFPFRYSAEKLYRRDNIYDIILVLNYNLKPYN